MDISRNHSSQWGSSYVNDWKLLWPFSFNVTFSAFCRVDGDYFTKHYIQHFNISTLRNTSLKLFFFLTSAEIA